MVQLRTDVEAEELAKEVEEVVEEGKSVPESDEDRGILGELGLLVGRKLTGISWMSEEETESDSVTDVAVFEAAIAGNPGAEDDRDREEGGGLDNGEVMPLMCASSDSTEESRPVTRGARLMESKSMCS